MLLTAEKGCDQPVLATLWVVFGRGSGGGENTGQRKGNEDANGDLPLPMMEYEMMQQEVSDNLNNKNEGTEEDTMTPEVEAQVKAAKAEAWKRLLEKIDMDEAEANMERASRWAWWSEVWKEKEERRNKKEDFLWKKSQLM